MNKVYLVLSAILLVACCFAQPLVAQNPTTKVKRGYKIEFTRVLPQAMIGEVPVRVRITRVPAVPSASDESLTVTMDLNNGWGDTSQSEFSAELVLPAGKTSAEVELLVDLQDSYYSLIVERGSHTKSRGNDLIHDQINLSRNMRQGRNNDASWLLISSKAPKTHVDKLTRYPGAIPVNSNVFGVIPSAPFAQSFRGDKAIPGLSKIFNDRLVNKLNRPNWHALRPAELPETWVGLSSINYVLISNDEFKSLTQVADYRKMIEQWVAAGGCLIVFNAENSLSHADSVFPSLLGPERAKKARMWAPVGTGNRGLSVHSSRNLTPKPASELVAKDRAAISPYLNGLVTVTVSPEELPGWFANRHFQGGNTIVSESTRINGFGRESAIPGVGKPPIALFGVFTGVFLFLIGPVILMIVTLNNDRRFLFFLVPLFSFLTCTGILGYAIVADFNRQLARTDTITSLDSRSGLAYTKAYSAYYCGSQPAYYAYDTDTLVQTTIENESGYRILQLPDENRLSSPRIQPRKNHEVFTAKPYRTQQRFLVSKSAKDSNIPEVTNLLGGRIARAVFEYQGKAFIVRDLEPKQTGLGVELTLEQRRLELRKAVADQQIRGGSPLFRSGESSAYGVVTSLTNADFKNKMKARDFVAVLDVNPAIDSLIEPFDYKLQLHVVHGKY